MGCSSTLQTVLALCIVLVTFSDALKHGNYGMLGLPGGSKRFSKSLPPAQWFNQRLDHFVQQETRNWSQRYFSSDAYYKPGGPVFLMIGGEGAASPKWLVGNQDWLQLAKKVGAYCFMLEHRFYGASNPTPDSSVENLRWLSSEQALADAAAFRIAMTDKHNFGEAKWVSFGGSYPGSLSAWFRLKYPHLVHAAVSSSAPLLAEVDFPAYMEVVRDSLATTGPGCVKNIAAATANLSRILTKGSGQELKDLKKQFNLCEIPNQKNILDIHNLQNMLSNIFAGTVQYNHDNRMSDGYEAKVDIDYLCNIMNDTSRGSPLQRYADANKDGFCLDFSYKKMIQSMKVPDFQAGRLWTYQTCNEFGFYQTTDNADQPFRGFPLSFSIQQCIDVFGSKFNQTYLQLAARATNRRYGARNITQSRIVFVNGSIDPWHALGLIKQTKVYPDNLVIYIKGTAHCANMYPPKPDDLPQLKQARIQIHDQIEKWLKEV